MNLGVEFKNIKNKINEYENRKNKEEYFLPEACCFLSNDYILCNNRKDGDSRYPYMKDGLVLWAFSSGYIFLGESTFQIFPPIYEGKEPYINFYLGKKLNDESYFPLSINGTGKFAFEKDIKRYCVYTPYCGYYFMETKDNISTMLRIFLDDDKKVYFSLYIENEGNREEELYISSFFNPLLRFAQNETFEDKWFKECESLDGGFIFDNSILLPNKNVVHKYLGISTIYSKGYCNLEKTTSRSYYVGDKNGSISSSINLINGNLNETQITKFTDTAVAGDMVKFNLKKGCNFRVDYVLKMKDKKENLSKFSFEGIDELEEIQKIKDVEFAKDFNIEFKEIEKPLYDTSFNYFIKNVQRQVDFCGSGRNYAGHLLGVRDLFQSIEAMVLWNKKIAKNKIIEALSFCGENGRMPRQYSVQADKNVLPELDMRAFIDQGNWVFDAVYQYIAYTNDYDILKEICGYYKYGQDDDFVGFSFLKEDVFSHLKRIMNYLISYIDENTYCLRALFGDWNDALDGLGLTEDKNKRYGTGVSVMATLHLVKNLMEFSKICNKLGFFKDEKYYLSIRENIIDGLKNNAIQKKDNNKKILHGWGDKRKYFVGSFLDVDGKTRDSLVVNAFWVISGLIEKTPELESSILECFKRLESKYGFLTFKPAFKEGTKGVGRIPFLPEGTAENGASYNHASLFGAWALFMLGENKWAWNIIYKVLPLTHKNITVTPFIMNNSYVENKKYNMDGQSMNDWHTGCANVFIKILVRFVCGINVDLEGVIIKPEIDLPAKNLKVSLVIKNKTFIINYNHKETIKKFIINGKECKLKNNSYRILDEYINNTNKIIIETY